MTGEKLVGCEKPFSADVIDYRASFQVTSMAEDKLCANALHIARLNILLAFVAFVLLQLSGADEICQVETYKQLIEVNGRRADITMGQCVAVSKFYIRSGISINGNRNADFYVAKRNCCCMVNSYRMRTRHISNLAVSYKFIRSCACGPCY